MSYTRSRGPSVSRQLTEDEEALDARGSSFLRSQAAPPSSFNSGRGRYLWMEQDMKMRAMQLDHVKRFGRQLIAEKGALSKIEKDKLKKGISGSILEYETGKGKPEPIPYPAIQTDIYAIENRIDMDKDNISGQPSVVRSAPQKTQSRTLGELNKLMGSFEGRQSEPQGIVEDFSEEVAKKLIGLMQQYFKAEKYIQVGAIDQEFLAREMKDNPAADRLDATGFLLKPDDIKNIDFEVNVKS